MAQKKTTKTTKEKAAKPAKIKTEAKKAKKALPAGRPAKLIEAVHKKSPRKSESKAAKISKTVKIESDVLDRQAESPVVSAPLAPHRSQAPVKAPDQKEEIAPPSPGAEAKEKAAATAVVETKEPPAPVKRKITLTPRTTVKDLAGLLGVGVPEIIKKLMALGVWATINQKLEPETATLVANEFGFEAEVPQVFEQEEALLRAAPAADPKDLSARAPIVTIMGHVDHGKTTLLDAIRETRVAEQEAGGITQHIGAYKVKTSRGEIVFLDTPGHEAFTAMRARGAKVTDMVVLVVAADDKVMPQTVEAIDHAKAGGVKIVVAINKIDKPEANVNRIKQELANHDLMAEDWGGKTVMVEVSAKKKINLDKLLEMIALEAELMELKADPKRPAVGAVLEARKDSKRGNVASILIQDGTLRIGDPFVCGITWGKVRALIDDRNAKMQQAGPATPALLMGLSDVPQAGDRLIAVDNERKAKEHATTRAAEFQLVHGNKSTKHLMLEDIHEKISQGLMKEFKIILRTDMQGSLEAIVGELSKLHHEEVAIKVLHAGVGPVSLSDVLLAAASEAVILGFHVPMDVRAQEEAQKEKVECRVYSVIYELVGDVRAALEGLLAPIIKENVLGAADVRAAFRVSGVGPVAGCFVTQGKINRGTQARVWRGDAKFLDGKVTSLKRVKEDVTEVTHGYECGIVVSGYNEPRKGDRIECFETVKELKKLTQK
ncbi:MAG: translation initiation factor IF-2 [Elusimicrobia bacterium]|nr:translation initiation factor IF-2 [Elusimicrobiota bacterium]